MLAAKDRGLTAKDLGFLSDGVKLVGRLYRPQVEPAPVIVMAHGFSGVAEQLDAHARRFVAAGFAVFVFDHPGFGRSGGWPRQEVDPQKQIAAYRDAISAVSDLAAVRADAIGVWGTSFSGGHVLATAAVDRRVKAAVAQVPFISGSKLMAGRTDAAALKALCAADQERRAGGGAPAVMRVTSDGSSPCALPGADAHAYFASTAGSQWVNSVTLSTFDHIAAFEPAAAIAAIAPTPLLMIIATEDAVAPVAHARDAFAAAGEPKQLVEISGGHFDVYGGAKFERADGAAIAFFKKYLV